MEVKHPSSWPVKPLFSSLNHVLGWLQVRVNNPAERWDPCMLQAPTHAAPRMPAPSEHLYRPPPAWPCWERGHGYLRSLGLCCVTSCQRAHSPRRGCRMSPWKRSGEQQAELCDIYFLFLNRSFRVNIDHDRSSSRNKNL